MQGSPTTTTGGGGLGRFWSAPASWFDALLEDDDPLKLSGSQTQGSLTHLLTAGTSGSGRASSHYIQPDPDPGFFESGGGGGTQVKSEFQRMNSSPAEFTTGNVDGCFSNYGSLKRFRDSHETSLLRGEQGSQLSGSGSGLLDLEMDKLLEDAVPCRVRAKRGCATHPRSIAERVRRTRISDRIRKLQELVPNMDKQTNTADMLEEAVEYVKTLQKQIQDLTDVQKKCTCIAKS